ncbi:MAG TPA: hypothetical protein V6C97_19910 [Oculatellaceae cyanobacterium]
MEAGADKEEEEDEESEAAEEQDEEAHDDKDEEEEDRSADDEGEGLEGFTIAVAGTEGEGEEDEVTAAGDEDGAVGKVAPGPVVETRVGVDTICKCTNVSTHALVNS